MLVGFSALIFVVFFWDLEIVWFVGVGMVFDLGFDFDFWSWLGISFSFYFLADAAVLFGAGMFWLETLKLAPNESLLPKGTSQLGPPEAVYMEFSDAVERKFVTQLISRLHQAWGKQAYVC
ncbi:hypothetical protein L1987_32798 [Smallanthus sonchifolius]|uniref:Uncharacterized protein n=1 Tax=Smallanthus sonchifolius TaxID=185202 RepID=A0ACB9HQY9_9ASTR|nr:hypothetical protein L1987_32798 [Smallanthus sonchifolius]